MRATALGLALALSACTNDLTPSEPPPRLLPDADGLAVTGTGLRIDFGRSPAGVIPLLDKILGPHRPLPLRNCPPGVTQNLQWSDLALTFTAERFVGWQENGRSAGQGCPS